MPGIANVSLTDTFDTWRIITNQLIVGLDQSNGFISNTSNDISNTVNTNLILAYDQANTAARNWANTRLANVVAGQPLTISWSTTNGYTNATVNISTSGVTTNTYGGTTQVPVLTVDSYGRLTYAANISFISGATVQNETTSASTHYPIFTTLSSGNLTSSNVNTTGLTFVPSTGTLSSTSFNSLSDVSLKDDIQPITNSLDILKSISGVSFTWKSNGNKSYGVVAQEIEKYIPDLVGKMDRGKTVNYDGIIAFLIQAVKEMSEEIDNLKKKQ